MFIFIIIGSLDLLQQVMFESDVADAVIHPILRFFGLHWQPSHGFTPYLGALAFTTTVSTVIAIKQVVTGKTFCVLCILSNSIDIQKCNYVTLISIILLSIITWGTVIMIVVFLHVRKTGGSVVKAFVDLIPFLVFFPSLLYYGAVSEIALKKYPLIMVTIILFTLLIVS